MTRRQEITGLYFTWVMMPQLPLLKWNVSLSSRQRHKCRICIYFTLFLWAKRRDCHVKRQWWYKQFALVSSKYVVPFDKKPWFFAAIRLFVILTRCGGAFLVWYMTLAIAGTMQEIRNNTSTLYNVTSICDVVLISQCEQTKIRYMYIKWTQCDSTRLSHPGKRDKKRQIQRQNNVISTSN